MEAIYCIIMHDTFCRKMLSIISSYLSTNEPTVSIFEEIQGYRGCGEDRGGGRRGASENVC